MKILNLTPQQNYRRVFIGIPLPNKFQADFEQLQRDLVKIDADLVLVDKTTPHILLVFLGQKTGTEIETVLPQITEIFSHVSPFSVSVHGLGIFGNRFHRVIYLKVAENEQLAKLAKQLHLRLLGQDDEQSNPYIPHLTVARKKEAGELMPELNERLDQIHWQFQIREIAIYGASIIDEELKQQRLVNWNIVGIHKK